jgi:PIN domain nuclease of toxin-antitoxin system
VKLLLDTHVVLWWCADSRRLKAAVRKAIASADLVWVSAASGWEVAIKQSVGKLTLDEPFSTLVRQSDFDELPVTLDHAERFRTLPPHHTDLFDRMLIAQAKAEAVTIVTHDRQFESYQVPILWV